METFTKHRYFSGYMMTLIITLLSILFELAATKGQLSLTNFSWSLLILGMGLSAMPIQAVISNIKTVDSRDIVNMLVAILVIVSWFCIVITYNWKYQATYLTLVVSLITLFSLSILFFKN